MRLNNIKIFSYIFLVVGLIFMTAGIAVTISMENNLNKLKENGVKTTGVINNIVTYSSGYGRNRTANSTVFVTFTTKDGTAVTAKLNYYTSNMYKGEPVTLYYDPSNPSKIGVDNFIARFLLLFICGGIGLVFSIIGAVMLTKSYLLKKRKATLISAGYSVMADVYDVRVNYSLRFNHKNSFIIYCKYAKNGKNYLFKSKNIWFNPSYLINTKIKVWVNQNNYNIYYIDTDNLIQN